MNIFQFILGYLYSSTMTGGCCNLAMHSSCLDATLRVGCYPTLPSPWSNRSGHDSKVIIDNTITVIPNYLKEKTKYWSINVSNPHTKSTHRKWGTGTGFSFFYWHYQNIWDSFNYPWQKHAPIYKIANEIRIILFLAFPDSILFLM